mgnify:CR=1 FL=1
MIPITVDRQMQSIRKPRASGDDPEVLDVELRKDA